MMKKKYLTPTLTIESLGYNQLLTDTSNINIGGTGRFEAKSTNYYDWDWDFDEDESE